MTISSPEGPSDEEFLPIEPPNEEESLAPVSTQPGNAVDAKDVEGVDFHSGRRLGAIRPKSRTFAFIFWKTVHAETKELSNVCE